MTSANTSDTTPQRGLGLTLQGSGHSDLLEALGAPPFPTQAPLGDGAVARDLKGGKTDEACACFNSLDSESTELHIMQHNDDKDPDKNDNKPETNHAP